MHDSTKAEQVFSFIPQAGTHPPPQQKQLWEEILKVIPTDLSAIDRALHPIAEKHIRATSHDARLPFLIDYSRAVIRHHFSRQTCTCSGEEPLYTPRQVWAHVSAKRRLPPGTCASICSRQSDALSVSDDLTRSATE
jgi:hypothetical protein